MAMEEADKNNFDKRGHSLNGRGALYRVQEFSDTKIRQKIDNLHTVMQQLPRRALV